MTESERIDFLIRVFEKGNAASFARKLGLSNSAIVRMRKGEIGITKRIDDILKEYPTVNREWLESGEGDPGDLTMDMMKAKYEERIRRNEEVINYLMNRIKELEGS